MLLLSEFFNVSRDAVKHWPSAPAWGRMNTFSYLIRRADLVESALGRSYDDYLKGYFWSRDWVLGGADPDKMEKEYGILAIEKNEKIKTKILVPIKKLLVKKKKEILNLGS